MRRLLAIAVPAVLLLATPAAAPAKGILSAKVCGADGCRPAHPSERDVLGGGAPADPPARREPFVRVEVEVGVPDHTERIRLLFLPRSELMLADDGGTWMVPLALTELRALAGRVRPFPANALPAWAPVGKDAAAKGYGASRAAGLSGGSEPAAGAASQPAATAAGTEPGGASPGAPPAASSPRSLANPAGSDDGWWLALPGAAIVLAAGVLLARRRRRDPPAPAAGAA